MNGRIVALDVGDRRIGVAACDPMGIVVRPVGVVFAEPRERAIQDIARIVKDEEAVEIVVGLPLTLRGEHGPQAQRVTAFVDALKAAVDLPIVFRDERYTSVEAERIIEERGRRSKKRRQQQRGEVDQIAASLILQDYINERQRQQRELLDPWDDDRPDPNA